MDIMRLVRQSIFGTNRFSGPASRAASFYAIKEPNALGEEVDFEQFRGKVVYAGKTKAEYASFVKLHSQFSSRGLEMVLFPCQQYGSQELKTGPEVVEFAKGKGFEGTVMSIDDVKGENARQSWRFFYEQTNAPEPVWNFMGKFLVSRTGEVAVTTGETLESDIEKLINA